MFHVLIIDDDKATVDVIRDTMDWNSFSVDRVLEAYNIEQAKAILNQEDMDIIISDIEMPKGTGLELLDWVRRENKPGEFLLLTCHENFSYASQAVHAHAADYLLKPFDASVMGMALRKIVSGLIEKRRLLENDQWVRENQRRMQYNFWGMLFHGQYNASAENRMSKQFASEGMDTHDRSLFLVVSKITNPEKDRDRYGSKLLQFALENVHSEILCGTPENRSAVCLDFQKYIAVASVCTAESRSDIEQRCRCLLKNLNAIISGEVTCCICRECAIDQMYDTFHRALEKISSNVANYGSFFWIEDAKEIEFENTDTFELQKLELYLEQNRKREFLEHIKIRMEEAKDSNQFTEKLLLAMRQEILQVIYVDLSKNGIRASHITQDEALNNLSQKSTQSALDMLRWATGIVNAAFQLKQELTEENNLQKQVDRYIEQHYAEDIGREQIAEFFYLSPGYLGKIYKKSAGISINDKLMECRLNHARQLLSNPNVSISDVAGETGFVNQAYFSTIFKKNMGQTPNEYRKSVLGGLERKQK